MSLFETIGYEKISYPILSNEETKSLKKQLDAQLGSKFVEPHRGIVRMVYCPDSAEYVFDRVKKNLEDFLEESLLPTYWFCTQYFNGSFMRDHYDREECEISVSLNISQDKPWKLFISDKQNVQHGLETFPGEGILYSGTECNHWREPYSGVEYTQLFLHYVRENGKYADYSKEELLYRKQVSNV